jgi:hypothetical protein
VSTTGVQLAAAASFSSSFFHLIIFPHLRSAAAEKSGKNHFISLVVTCGFKPNFVHVVECFSVVNGGVCVLSAVEF